MWIIEVRIKPADFGKTLIEMEQWLVHKNRPLVQFEFETECNGDISIKVEFEANDLAEQFRQALHGSYGV
jgi:hypothetical protein